MQAALLRVRRINTCNTGMETPGRGTQPSATPDTGSTGPPSPVVTPPYLNPEELIRRAFVAGAGSSAGAAGEEEEADGAGAPRGWWGLGGGPQQYTRLAEAAKDPLHALQLPPDIALRSAALGLPLGASGAPLLVAQATGPLADVLQG